MTQQEYKIVSVRLTKTEWALLMAHVDNKKQEQSNYKISDLLRAIIGGWVARNV